MSVVHFVGCWLNYSIRSVEYGLSGLMGYSISNLCSFTKHGNYSPGSRPGATAWGLGPLLVFNILSHKHMLIRI